MPSQKGNNRELTWVALARHILYKTTGFCLHKKITKKPQEVQCQAEINKRKRYPQRADSSAQPMLFLLDVAQGWYDVASVWREQTRKTSRQTPRLSFRRIGNLHFLEFLRQRVVGHVHRARRVVVCLHWWLKGTDRQIQPSDNLHVVNQFLLLCDNYNWKSHKWCNMSRMNLSGYIKR